MTPYAHIHRRPRQAGLSLIELMISMTLGLLIIGSVLTIFTHTADSHNEFRRANQQMENGRYAIQSLREELWLAGFWGEFASSGTPTAVVDACLGWASLNATNKSNLLLLPVQGYNADLAGTTATEPTISGNCSTAITNRKAGTDVLIIRHAATCAAGATGCDAYAATNAYLQANLCSTATGIYAFDLGSSGNLSLLKKDCSSTADRRQFQSYIYYVSSGNVLMRSSYGYDASAGGVIAQAPEQIVEGIDNLQVEYALDTNGDGNPDSYTSSPANATQWSQVVAVKLYVLARNTEASSGYSDTKTYNMGSGASSVGPFGDNIRRHLFSTVVRLVNPAGRKDTP